MKKKNPELPLEPTDSFVKAYFSVPENIRNKIPLTKDDKQAMANIAKKLAVTEVNPNLERAYQSFCAQQQPKRVRFAETPLPPGPHYSSTGTTTNPFAEDNAKKFIDLYREIQANKKVSNEDINKLHRISKEMTVDEISRAQKQLGAPPEPTQNKRERNISVPALAHTMLDMQKSAIEQKRQKQIEAEPTHVVVQPFRQRRQQ